MSIVSHRGILYYGRPANQAAFAAVIDVMTDRIYSGNSIVRVLTAIQDHGTPSASHWLMPEDEAAVTDAYVDALPSVPYDSPEWDDADRWTAPLRAEDLDDDDIDDITQEDIDAAEEALRELEEEEASTGEYPAIIDHGALTCPDCGGQTFRSEAGRDRCLRCNRLSSMLDLVDACELPRPSC